MGRHSGLSFRSSYFGNAPSSAPDLLAKAREARSATPTAITLKADPAAPAEIAFGGETTLFVNPYSGQVLGEGSQRVRSFFRTMTDWHRWLGAKGDNRNVARAQSPARAIWVFCFS